MFVECCCIKISNALLNNLFHRLCVDVVKSNHSYMNLIYRVEYEKHNYSTKTTNVHKQYTQRHPAQTITQQRTQNHTQHKTYSAQIPALKGLTFPPQEVKELTKKKDLQGGAYLYVFRTSARQRERQGLLRRCPSPASGVYAMPYAAGKQRGVDRIRGSARYHVDHRHRTAIGR